MKFAFLLCLLSTLAGPALTAQAIPNDLPEKPFFITKTWMVGGEGSWDALTMDPEASQLWIAHSRLVQVVDIATGSVIGNIDGFVDARSIAFGKTGEFAYISDSASRRIKVIDRRSLQLKRTIPVAEPPRGLYFDPVTELLFALPVPGPAVSLPSRTNQPRLPQSGAGSRRPPVSAPPDPNATSVMTVIDTQKQAVLGQIWLPGKVDSGQSDGRGELYLTLPDRNQILSIDGSEVLRRLRDGGPDGRAVIDWSTGHGGFFLAPACTEPRGLAVDGKQQRIFVACGNDKLTVWNPAHGELVASVPVRVGTTSIVFDADRNLLFAASSYGMLTVVRQYVTDTYTVIQNLPTRWQARTLALNQTTGEVYLVTNELGFDLTKPGGIGKLQSVPVPGSFQVLVIGN